MSLFDLFAYAVAGANGGLVYWIISRRKMILARVRSRKR